MSPLPVGRPGRPCPTRRLSLCVALLADIVPLMASPGKTIIRPPLKRARPPPRPAQDFAFRPQGYSPRVWIFNDTFTG